MTGQYKVLVVEDLLLAQKIAMMVLNNIRCDAQSASNGIEAIEAVKREKFDLILMDLGLPDTDGITLTRKMREFGGWLSDVPIVALTAHSDKQIRNQAQDAGINGFFVKPMTMKVGTEIKKEFLEQAICAS